MNVGARRLNGSRGVRPLWRKVPEPFAAGVPDPHFGGAGKMVGGYVKID